MPGISHSLAFLYDCAFSRKDAGETCKYRGVETPPSVAAHTKKVTWQIYFNEESNRTVESCYNINCSSAHCLC